MTALIPSAANPFYIVAPPFSRNSAGTVCLYILCDQLNRLGYPAYIVLYPYRKRLNYKTKVEDLDFYNLRCPIISDDIISYYDQKCLTPVVIYPEILDNPYGAKFYGRYILNTPGLLAPMFKGQENFRFFYSRQLLSKYWEGNTQLKSDPTLFLPTCDLSYWFPSKVGVRCGTCFYAKKAISLGAFDKSLLPEGSVEILSAPKMSRDEVRNIFRSYSMFYCYEDTALAIEARLCGCPVTWVPNSHFSGHALAEEEVGFCGARIWGDDSDQFEAESTVGQFREYLHSHILETPNRISYLAQQWVELAKAQDYKGTINPLGPPDFGVPRVVSTKLKHAPKRLSRCLRRISRRARYSFATW